MSEIMWVRNNEGVTYYGAFKITPMEHGIFQLTYKGKHLYASKDKHVCMEIGNTIIRAIQIEKVDKFK